MKDNEVENADLIETINSEKRFNGRTNARSTRTLAINFGKPFLKKPKKHDTYPGIGFYEHEQSKKHSDGIRNKTEIKAILSTGNNLFQLQKRAENRTEYEHKQNRELIKKTNQNCFFSCKEQYGREPIVRKICKIYCPRT